jgi:hypothetical protein
MNEWGHLEQRNLDKHDTSKKDRIFQPPKQGEGAQVARTGADAAPSADLSSLNAREQVEKTADRIRDELVLTLEELDRRRDRVLDVRYQVSRHQDVLIGVAANALVLTSVGVGVAIWRARHRQELLAKKRRLALQRAWRHPDRLATRAEQRPFAVEMGKKLIMIFGTALASSIAKSSVQSLVPRRNAQAAQGQK